MLRFCGFLISSLVTSQGPSGPKVSQPLPLVHWPKLDLEFALGDVVGNAVAGDRIHRLALREIARACADHDAELDS